MPNIGDKVRVIREDGAHFFEVGTEGTVLDVVGGEPRLTLVSALLETGPLIQALEAEDYEVIGSATLH